MAQSNKKKEVLFEQNALKEFLDFPWEVRKEFEALVYKLETDGFLKEPEAKKLTKDLLEMRVIMEDAWRAIYAYYKKDEIIVLVCFNKKQQKTLKQYIDNAYNRLKRL